MKGNIDRPTDARARQYPRSGLSPCTSRLSRNAYRCTTRVADEAQQLLLEHRHGFIGRHVDGVDFIAAHPCHADGSGAKPRQEMTGERYPLAYRVRNSRSVMIDTSS